MGLVIAVVLSACSSGGDKRGGDSPATSAADTPSGYHGPAQPRRVGAGLLETVSVDGSALYVSAREATPPKTACGRQPEPVLFRLPLAGGAPEALASAADPTTGAIIRGTGGRIALVSRCDGVVTGVRTGAETADGRVRDLRPLDLGEPQRLTAFGWSADGQSLLTARTTAGGAQAPSSVARVDPVSGRATPVFEVTGAISQITQLTDGSYVTSGSGKVSVRESNGSVKTSVDGEGFAVAPNGLKLVVWGRYLIFLPLDDPASATLATGQGEESFGPADFSPDGQAIAYAKTVPGGGAVAVVTLSDRRVSEFNASPGPFPRVLFSPDGRSVFFSHAPTDTGEDASVQVVHFRP